MAASGRHERLAIHLWGVAERFDGRETRPTPRAAFYAQDERTRERWRMIARAAWRAADAYAAEHPETVRLSAALDRRIQSGEPATSPSSTSSPT